MKQAKALRSRGGMTIAELIISIMLIFIMVLVFTPIAGFVKERCVSGKNRLEANKLAMYVLEKLLPLPYTTLNTDPHLSPNTPINPQHNDITDPVFLPTSGLNGYSIFYTVTNNVWDAGHPYKEIVVTVNWTGMTSSFGVLKRQR